MRHRSFATTWEILANYTINVLADMRVLQFLTSMEGESTFCDTPTENICFSICPPGYSVKPLSSKNVAFDKRLWIPLRHTSADERLLLRMKRRSSKKLLSHPPIRHIEWLSSLLDKLTGRTIQNNCFSQARSVDCLDISVLRAG